MSVIKSKTIGKKNRKIQENKKSNIWAPMTSPLSKYEAHSHSVYTLLFTSMFIKAVDTNDCFNSRGLQRNEIQKHFLLHLFAELFMHSNKYRILRLSRFSFLFV